MTSSDSQEHENGSLEQSASRRNSIVKLVLGIIAIGALLYVGRSAGGLVPAFAEWVEGLGVLGPIVFIVGYAVAVVAFIPGSVMTLAAGAIFGVAEGTLYVIVAATLGISASSSRSRRRA